MADLTQQAFTAGQNWWHTGQHTSGVANARVVRYGFLKWWNNQSPSATRGHSKGYPEKAFREGWNRGKKGPQRIPNGRLVPARIRHKGKTYPGKVKRVNGRVRIFVTPQVARKINPGGVRHTSCRYCGLDIEGIYPYRKGEWRDRGNNTTCPSCGPYSDLSGQGCYGSGKHKHAPYIEKRK